MYLIIESRCKECFLVVLHLVPRGVEVLSILHFKLAVQVIFLGRIIFLKGLREKWLGVEVVLEVSCEPGISAGWVTWSFGNMNGWPTSLEGSLPKLGVSLLLAVLYCTRSLVALFDGLVVGDSQCPMNPFRCLSPNLLKFFFSLYHRLEVGLAVIAGANLILILIGIESDWFLFFIKAGSALILIKVFLVCVVFHWGADIAEEWVRALRGGVAGTLMLD